MKNPGLSRVQEKAGTPGSDPAKNSQIQPVRASLYSDPHHPTTPPPPTHQIIPTPTTSPSFSSSWASAASDQASTIPPRAPPVNPGGRRGKCRLRDPGGEGADADMGGLRVDLSGAEIRVDPACGAAADDGGSPPVFLPRQPAAPPLLALDIGGTRVFLALSRAK